MKCMAMRAWWVALATGLLVPSVSAQGVSVLSETESVVISGDSVRVDDADDSVVVAGDWRRGGAVGVQTDTGSVLIGLGAVVEGDRIQVNLEGDVLFDFDSSRLAPAAKARLAQVATLIRAKAVGAAHVIGHTDALGRDDYNARLSRERALAVIRHLHDAEGIPYGVLVGHGVGAKHPLAANTLANGADNPQGRARNRRVEIQIATREGVALGPGQVLVSGDRIVTNEASIDAGGVSTDEARVDIGRGGVTVSEHDDGDGDGDGDVASIVSGAMAQAGLASAPSAAAATQPMAGGACELMCQASSGRQSMATIACIEETLEEMEFDFDADACDEFEDAMATGSGNYGGQQCRSCRKAEGYGDAHCLRVIKACFPNKR
ncbi:MAG: OmpA family protein [Xanthomonadales bacterium]|nr:OmpA family protein [Xanthomonadales bacterium]